jgi:hypothetical protein
MWRSASLPPSEGTTVTLVSARRSGSGYPSSMYFHSHFMASLVRFAVTVVLLMLGVGWVSPHNKSNTVGRAVVVSLVLGAAWYLTLAHWYWWAVLPWLLYVVVYFIVVAIAYGLGFVRGVLLALALAFLSFLVGVFFGFRPHLP